MIWKDILLTCSTIHDTLDSKVRFEKQIQYRLLLARTNKKLLIRTVLLIRILINAMIATFNLKNNNTSSCYEQDNTP